MKFCKDSADYQFYSNLVRYSSIGNIHYRLHSSADCYDYGLLSSGDNYQRCMSPSILPFETLCAAAVCAKYLGDMEVQEIHEKINTTENSAMATARIL